MSKVFRLTERCFGVGLDISGKGVGGTALVGPSTPPFDLAGTDVVEPGTVDEEVLDVGDEVCDDGVVDVVVDNGTEDETVVVKVVELLDGEVWAPPEFREDSPRRDFPRQDQQSSETSEPRLPLNWLPPIGRQAGT